MKSERGNSLLLVMMIGVTLSTIIGLSLSRINTQNVAQGNKMQRLAMETVARSAYVETNALILGKYLASDSSGNVVLSGGTPPAPPACGAVTTPPPAAGATGGNWTFTPASGNTSAQLQFALCDPRFANTSGNCGQSAKLQPVVTFTKIAPNSAGTLYSFNAQATVGSTRLRWEF